MNEEKLNIAIVFGGRSPEHNISLLSARNVINSLDKEKFNPILVGISKSGKWYINKPEQQISTGVDVKSIAITSNEQQILLSQNADQGQIIDYNDGTPLSSIDVIFPVLHGNYGEDGSIQGLAKLADIPCVGCGIAGSAVGMDKDLMKRILRDAGIKVAPGITIRKSDEQKPDYHAITKKYGSDLFLKPSNLGSSVGVSFVQNASEFISGLAHAFEYDSKVLVEQRLLGRELECGILGNMQPEASVIGEVKPKDGFYSFKNKYVDEKGAELAIPARITDSQKKEIQKIAIQTFKVLECRGIARVDVFLTPENEVFVNEINTIPGFTNISMYPKLWEATGLSNQDLITKLIELAIQEHKSVNSLKSIF